MFGSCECTRFFDADYCKWLKSFATQESHEFLTNSLIIIAIKCQCLEGNKYN